MKQKGAAARERLAKAVADGTALSPCCDAPLDWESFQGMRMVRERKGRYVYSAECSKCTRRHEFDGGTA